jgi:hypothetical protein
VSESQPSVIDGGPERVAAEVLAEHHEQCDLAVSGGCFIDRRDQRRLVVVVANLADG